MNRLWTRLLPSLFAGVGLVAAAAAPAVCASASKAGEADPGLLVEKAFGNTIVSTYPDGRKAELWLKADGSYSALGRHNDPSSGKWKVSGDKLCLRQSSPFPAPFHFCTPIPQKGMGKSWTAKAITGERISVTLVRGGAPSAGDD